MKRKEYEKPTMQIVLLKGSQPLLAGSYSSGGTGTQDYNWNDNIPEE